MHLFEDKQLFRENKYNIVTGENRIPSRKMKSSPQLEEKIIKTKPRNRDFCIITTKNIDKNGYFKKIQSKDKNPRKVSEKTKREFRNYDVITNTYVKENKAKQSRDALFEKKVKTCQYFYERKFDPLLQKHVHPRKEDEEFQKHKTKRDTHYSRAVESRPEFIKNSEGGCENIFTGEKKSKRAPKADRLAQRHLNTYKKGHQKYEEWKRITARPEGILKFRRSYQSGAEIQKASLPYHIISNIPHEGRNGKKPPYNPVPERVNLWKTLNYESN